LNPKQKSTSRVFNTKNQSQRQAPLCAWGMFGGHLFRRWICDGLGVRSERGFGSGARFKNMNPVIPNPD